MFTDFLAECRAHKLALPKAAPVGLASSIKDYAAPRLPEITVSA